MPPKKKIPKPVASKSKAQSSGSPNQGDKPPVNVQDQPVAFEELTPSQQKAAKANMNRQQAEDITIKVTHTEHECQHKEANCHLLGYCKVPLYSCSHLICMLNTGRHNDQEPDPIVFQPMALDFTDNGVLDAVYPIEMLVHSKYLSEACREGVAISQDPHTYDGETAPVLELQWWKNAGLRSKIIGATFGIDFATNKLLSDDQCSELWLECQRLGENQPQAELLAGGLCKMATISYAQTSVDRIAVQLADGNIDAAMNLVMQCKQKATFWAAVYGENDFPKETAIWMATNKPQIFKTTTAGELINMSMQIAHEQMTQLQFSKTAADAFAAEFTRICKVGNMHVGQPGHYLVDCLGHRTLYMMLKSLCGFPVGLNNSLNTNLTEIMCLKDIGGIMCALTLLSGLKLHRLTQVCKAYLDPSSSEWTNFKHRLPNLPDISELPARGSEQVDSMLETLLEEPGENVLRPNLAHTCTEHELAGYNVLYKIKHPGMTFSSCSSKERGQPPWRTTWGDAQKHNARELLTELSDAQQKNAPKSGP